jgi:hypothetical protein
MRDIVGITSAYWENVLIPKPSIRNNSSRPIGDWPIAK